MEGNQRVDIKAKHLSEVFIVEPDLDIEEAKRLQNKFTGFIS